jgi:mitochondrial fission protein ELM1
MTRNGPHRPVVWVLLSQKNGDNQQSLAIAESTGLPFEVKRLGWKASKAQEKALTRAVLEENTKSEARRRELGLTAPWPDAVICCGRRPERFAIWIKQQSGGRTKLIKIGRARESLFAYDLLIATPQFPMPDLPHVTTIRFPPTPPVEVPVAGRPIADSEFLRSFPKPWFAILLGGPIKQFRTSRKVLEDNARKIQAAADRTGGSVVITTSRRTPAKLLNAVLSGLTRTPYVHRWSADRPEDTSYSTLLQESAAVFVTADSISMMMDCVNHSAPTYVIELPKRLHLRGRWEMTIHGALNATARWSQGSGWRGIAGCIRRLQDWLHRRRFARFPKDTALLHRSLYQAGLARPACAFDPTTSYPRPPHGIAAHDMAATGAICRKVLEAAAR